MIYFEDNSNEISTGTDWCFYRYLIFSFRNFYPKVIDWQSHFAFSGFITAFLIIRATINDAEGNEFCHPNAQDDRKTHARSIYSLLSISIIYFAPFWTLRRLQQRTKTDEFSHKKIGWLHFDIFPFSRIYV